MLMQNLKSDIRFDNSALRVSVETWRVRERETCDLVLYTCRVKSYIVNIKSKVVSPEFIWYGAFRPLKGMRELSELVLERMALLVDPGRSDLPLRSAKAREFGDFWREKCMHAPRIQLFFLCRPEP